MNGVPSSAHRVTSGHRIGLALTATTLAFCLVPAAAAHDFWIQPENWSLAPKVPASFTLLVGHGADLQRTQISKSRVEKIEAVDAQGQRTDLRSRLDIGSKTSDLTTVFEKAGAYVLLFETDNAAQSHLPAAKFNEYLLREGLTPALSKRERSGDTARDGAENYSRHAKTIVQVGKVDPSGQTRVTRRLGLELEIVPEQSPLMLAPGAPLSIRVYYRGRALTGALVKLTDLEKDAEPLDRRTTDKDGRARFTIPHAGNWLLNVVWTRPQPAASLTDFNTSFSSLTFQIADR